MSSVKKRKKSYFCSSKRQCSGRDVLSAGLKGFLITCNRMEKQTIREAYNVLNEYSCKLYGEEAGLKEVVGDDDGKSEVDFEEAISDQVEALQGGGQETKARRFQVVDTKTSNCIFIRTTLSHPDELVTKLLTDVSATGKTRARFILKIFPVLGTCRATEDKIEKLVEELVSSYFADRPLSTFAIVYKVRCNSLSRDIILPIVGRAVYSACPTSRVDLGNPDYVISVDVLNKFAFVSIMKDFNRLRKYNLQELAKSVVCETSTAVEDRPVQDSASAADDVNCRQTELAVNASEPSCSVVARDKAPTVSDNVKSDQTTVDYYSVDVATSV